MLQTGLSDYNCRIDVVITDFNNNEVRRLQKACRRMTTGEEIYDKIKEVLNEY